jgi:hypothetical protein
MSNEPCKSKTYCFKQVNVHHPEYGYFGTPFEYDPNWLGCFLCYDTDEKEHVSKSESIIEKWRRLHSK